MRNLLTILTFTAVLAMPATAQIKATDVKIIPKETTEKADKPQTTREIGPNEITERAAARAYPLMGEWRARYLLRQLDLTSAQREAAEGLISTVLRQPAPQINLGRVRELMALMQQAEADGDAEAKARYTRELRQLGKVADNEPEFLDNLRLQITDAQKKKLDEALARLERNPSGHIRPVDLLALVEAMKLSDEQKKKIAELKEEQRKKSTSAGRLDDTRRAQMLRTLVRKMNEVLNESQRASLDAEIQKLRTDKVKNIFQMDAEAEKASKRMTGRRARP